jgi:hypothetical protein
MIFNNLTHLTITFVSLCSGTKAYHLACFSDSTNTPAEPRLYGGTYKFAPPGQR